MEELTSLPGIGRKTANVILGTCFDKPGIIVDTEGSGSHARVQVNFKQAGSKWLVLAYAKLETL